MWKQLLDSCVALSPFRSAFVLAGELDLPPNKGELKKHATIEPVGPRRAACRNASFDFRASTDQFVCVVAIADLLLLLLLLLLSLLHGPGAT